MPADRTPRWLPELPLGVAVAVLGLLEVIGGRGYDAVTSSPVALGSVTALTTALAVTLSRRRPALALAILTIGILATHVVLGGGLLLAEAGGAVVVANAARHGLRTTVGAALLVVPVTGTLLVVSARYDVVQMLRRLGIDGAFAVDTRFAVLAVGLIGVTALLPWLVGITLRARDRAASSREEAARAEQARAETAALERASAARAEAESARADLARDVHDVVGHSLAVILAQAEAAALLAQAPSPGACDPEKAAATGAADPRLLASLAAIADTARTSLGEVGAVLAGTRKAPSTGGAVADVLAQTQAAGTLLHTSIHGTARPLPPDLDVVAGRVLREMLANALRHGDRTAPVLVTQWWGAELVIEVENRIGDRTPGGGRGIAGMRGRLAAVGGTLFASAVEDRFVAQVRLPLAGAAG